MSDGISLMFEEDYSVCWEEMDCRQEDEAEAGRPLAIIQGRGAGPWPMVVSV